MKKNNQYFTFIYRYLVIAFGAITLLSSCKKNLDPGAPEGLLNSENVFTTDASAISAVSALYSYTYTQSFLLWNTTLAGMSADDVQFNTANSTWDEFKSNTISTDNTGDLNYWSYAYAIINEANAAIDGISASAGITASTKNQLLGEARFWRAFVYFHLYNLYGAVPLVINSTTLSVNKTLGRSDSATVYKQIITDLTTAQGLLTATYPSTYRARINLYTVDAFLARVYLYTKDYTDAEAQATTVIGSGVYSLGTDLSKVFKNTSNETIWQVASIYGYSPIGAAFVANGIGTLPSYLLYDTIYNSFSGTDSRKSNWVSADTVNSSVYHCMSKYKLYTATAGDEYTVLFRLAEQYLISAEARAYQNNLTGAKSDIDSIRVRAGLPVLAAGLSQTALLNEIMLQRKLELFGEFGQRWFDLKRTGTAVSVLSYLKPILATKPGHVLFPIPATQISLNSNLSQNADY